MRAVKLYSQLEIKPNICPSVNFIPLNASIKDAGLLVLKRTSKRMNKTASIRHLDVRMVAPT